MIMTLLFTLLHFTSQQQNQPDSIVPADNYYKSSFDPSDPLTIVGLVLMCIVMCLATLGGVGGNTVILPVCLIFFKFSPRVAIAHCALLSAIGSLSRTVYEQIQAHTHDHVVKGHDRTKPKANIHLVLLAAPPAVLGSFFGVTLNKLSPEIIIMGSSLILQVYLLYYSFHKYRVKSAEERLASAAVSGGYAGVKAGGVAEQTIDVQSASIGQEVGEQKGEVPEETDQSELTWVDFFLLVFMLAINPLFVYVRGSDVIPSLIQNKQCSNMDYLLLGTYVTSLLILCMMTRALILSRNPRRKVVADMDVAITENYTLKFMPSIFAVAFVGGFLSSGSCTLITMSMIVFGLGPFVASSTSLVVAVIFSGSSAMVYWLNGNIYPSCALIGGAVVALSTTLTRATLYQQFVRLGKSSIILLFIFVMLVFTIPSNLWQVVPHIKQEYDQGKDIWAFSSFCPKK